MSETIICQGRAVSESDLSMLRLIIRDHPDWSRHRITQSLCRHWGWRTHTGQLKTFAARSLIDKLEARGLITLPPIRVECRRPHRRSFPEVTPPQAMPIAVSFTDIAPVSFTLVAVFVKIVTNILAIGNFKFRGASKKGSLLIRSSSREVSSSYMNCSSFILVIGNYSAPLNLVIILRE